MKYAKSRPTQSEFVAAWWQKAEQTANRKLERDYPGIASVKLFNGMTYADKFWAIPNNAIRRAGLKPRRRNGERKKERTVLSQAPMQRILRGIDRAVTQIAALEMAKMTEQFADVGKMGEAFSENHYQEDALDAMLYDFEAATRDRPYIGRVMLRKDDPILRME